MLVCYDFVDARIKWYYSNDPDRIFVWPMCFFMLCWDHIFCSGLLVVTKVVMLLWEHQSYRIANQEFFQLAKDYV